jgi:hypothetical protein
MVLANIAKLSNIAETYTQCLNMIGATCSVIIRSK